MYKKTSACLVMLFLMAAPLIGESTKVNLNTATADQLKTLPGIGPALAARILEFREKNGPFKKPEDLMNVRGIGEKKYLDLADKITATSSAPRDKAAPEKPVAPAKEGEKKP